MNQAAIGSRRKSFVEPIEPSHYGDDGSGLPREHPLEFYTRRVWQTPSIYGSYALCARRIYRLRREVKRDPASGSHTDPALTPGTDAMDVQLERFEHTAAARERVAAATGD